jgi:hypothetical protein
MWRGEGREVGKEGRGEGERTILRDRTLRTRLNYVRIRGGEFKREWSGGGGGDMGRTEKGLSHS